MDIDKNNIFNDEEESSFDYKEWLGKILHYWYIVVAAAVIAVSFAYLTNRKWKPFYQVEARVILGGNDRNSQYAFMQGFNSDGLASNNDQLVLFGRDEMLQRTISKLPFEVEYFSQGRFKRNYFYKEFAPLTITTIEIAPEAYEREFYFQEQANNSFMISLSDGDGNTIFSAQGKFNEPLVTAYFSGIVQKNTMQFIEQVYFRFRSAESLQNEFASRLSFSLLDGTSVATVSLVGERVERDLDFINKLCEEFIADNLERKNLEATRTLDFIDQQLIFISDSLSSTNSRIHQFRRVNKIVNIENYMNELLGKSSDFKSKNIELNIKEAYFKYLENYLKTNIQEGEILAPSTLGISDPALIDLINQINDLQVKRSAIGVQNPFYEKYTQQIETLKQTLFEVLKNVNTVYEMDRKNFEKWNSDILAEINSLSEKETEILDVERQHQINNNYYTYLLQKRSEAQIRKASNISDITLLQKAKVVSITNANFQRSTYTKYTAIGIILAILLIVLKELLNNTVKTTNELEKITRFTTLGTIPYFTMKNGEVQTIHYIKSIFTEAFRILKTRVEFITQKKEDIIILVSSSESGDGKSYFSANLAGIYSLSGKKTLLIDMDLRKPSICDILNLNSQKGLSNILINDCTLDEAIISDSRLKFDVLPAGAIPPNPGELLASEKMVELLDELKQKYKFIIIDTSPLGLVSDAYPIARQTDLLFFISLCGKTNKSHLKETASILRNDKFANVYTILNGVKENKHPYGAKYSKVYTRNQKYYHTNDYFNNDVEKSSKK